MWCKFHIYLPMSKSKYYWDQCMPTSLQYTTSTVVPYISMETESISQIISLYYTTCTTYHSNACYTCTTFFKLRSLMSRHDPDKTLPDWRDYIQFMNMEENCITFLQVSSIVCKEAVLHRTVESMKWFISQTDFPS